MARRVSSASRNVEPVVTTSSMRMIVFGGVPRTINAPRILFSRSAALVVSLCGFAWRTRVKIFFATGMPVSAQSWSAISADWLKPRCRSRRRESGTGTKTAPRGESGARGRRRKGWRRGFRGWCHSRDSGSVRCAGGAPRGIFRDDPSERQRGRPHIIEFELPDEATHNRIVVASRRVERGFVRGRIVINFDAAATQSTARLVSCFHAADEADAWKENVGQEGYVHGIMVVKRD